MRHFTLLLLLLSAPAGARPLGAFLVSARARNLDARAAAAAVARADAEAAQSWAALLPSLSASAGWTRNQYPAEFDQPGAPGTETRRIVIVPENQVEAALRLEVPLVDVSRWLRVRSSARAAEAAALRRGATAEAVQRAVVAAYCQVAAAHALGRGAVRGLEVALALLATAEARVQAGTAPELDALRARAEVERNRQLVADAEALTAISARTLETLSGLSPAGDAALPVDDLHEEPPLSSLEQDLNGLPSVQAAARDAEVAVANRQAAWGMLAPTFSAQATQRFTNATGFQDQWAVWNAGVGMSWRGDVSALQAARALGAAEEAAEVTVARAQAQARDALHADWYRVRSAVEKLRAARAQSEAASRAATLAADRYAAGTATQVDVLQAGRDALAAELSLAQASAELAQSRASLRLSAHLPLEEAP
jgi:outer membrane protein TolC